MTTNIMSPDNHIAPMPSVAYVPQGFIRIHPQGHPKSFLLMHLEFLLQNTRNQVMVVQGEPAGTPLVERGGFTQ